MNFKTLALATVAVVGISGAASAATLQIVPGVPIAFETGNFKTNCSASGSFDATSCYNPSGPALGLGQNINAFFSAATYPGATITGPATIRVTFLGKEAGAVNSAFSVGGGSVSNVMAIGSSFVAMVGGPGTLDFSFRVTTGAGGAATGSGAGSAGFSGTAAIAFGSVFNGGRSVLAFFDDSGASNNRDWDDMVVQIDVVPVPAAGLLLLGGLGAMAALKRRRKAA